ncbi:anthranilate synthase component 1, partial [Coemansia sp. RSA 2559]
MPGLFQTKPSLESVRDLLDKSGGNFIPVYQDVPSDVLTPVTAYLKLAHGSKYSFLLESAYGGETIGRYSFIGASNKADSGSQACCATTKDSLGLLMLLQSCSISLLVDPYKVLKTGANEEIGGDPLIPLEKELGTVRYVQVPGLPRGSATGGAFGYITYDCVQYFEPRTACDLPDPIGVPDSMFLFCDTVVAFDHVYKQLKVITHIRVPDDAAKETLTALYKDATRTIRSTIDVLFADAIPFPEQPPIVLGNQFKSNTGEEGYKQMVTGLKAHILKGDIIQAVPAQRITRPTSLHPFNAYRHLRTLNPAPYMFYFDFGDFQAVGASPEMLASVNNGHVINHPIAGTRRRGDTPEEDERLAEELLADEKERAEHVMLVDLGRNDLNR